MNRNYEGGNKFNAATRGHTGKKNLCTQSKKSVRYFMCVLCARGVQTMWCMVSLSIYMYSLARPSYTIWSKQIVKS